MLAGLSVQNVVLIDRLTLDGRPGLSALTGETGAGKSILLDALGLALGARAEAGLVRHGADQAVVTASFDLPQGHPARAVLAERGIDTDGGPLVLRRVLAQGGGGKAFVNDQPATVQTLKDLGALLVEIHGQFDTHGLMDASTHKDALDAYAALTASARAVAASWESWRAARQALSAARERAEAAQAQRDFLTHAVAELDDLSPEPGEDEELAARRALLMNAEKMKGARDETAALIDSEGGLLSILGRAESQAARLGEAGGDVAAALTRARAELEEASYALSRLDRAGGGATLHEVEERYFALKALAKKHRCAPGDLPALHADFAARLRLAEGAGEELDALEKAALRGRADYLGAAEKLSGGRAKAAARLARAVQAELPALKLDKARFEVDCAPAPETAWGPGGIDRVAFLVATNPQTPAGPLSKIASGGELARFTLALKCVLAAAGGSVQTLIFDEVDTGIGGAVADAVGERLARLAAHHQVLAVTHSPQVAARAAHHWRVAKTGTAGGAVSTRVEVLSTEDERREEIARMLSGAEVTPEARAQAVRLLSRSEAA